jgi:hypothetical protein
MFQSRVLRNIPIVGPIIGWLLAVIRRQKIAHKIPTEAKVFQPFGLSKRPWSRVKELERLHELIIRSEDAHVVVTGASGAGKSTLVTKLYKEEYVDNAKTLYYQYSDYNQALLKFLWGLSCESRDLEASKQQVIASIEQTLKDHRYPITRSLHELSTLPEAEHAWRQLQGFLSEFLQAARRDSLFVFDQVERYLFLLRQSAAGSPEAVNALELYLIKRVLHLLRHAANCRTIFVIREDFLYKSLEFLLRRSSDETADEHPDSTFRIFLCEGINPDNSPQAVGEISQDFIAAAKFLVAKVDKFDRLVGLKSSVGANPFLTQLCGFMIEHFYRVDKRVRDFLDSAQSSDEVLPLFFDYVERDFIANNPDTANVQLLRAVLYGIALETKSTGLPATAERVAAIAHVPTPFAEQVYAYLRPHRIVVAEEEASGDAIRFTHDVLAEFVFHSDDMTFDAMLKEGETKLSENYVPSEKLKKLLRWAHFVDDIAHPSVGFAAIWIFYLFGLYRILSTWAIGIPLWGLNIKFNPNHCEWLHAHIQSVLPSYEIFATTSCSASRWYYPVEFAMHCLWVTYIYVVDRNYIQHVAESRLIRGIGALMPVIGAALGVLLAFSPIVHVVPVSVVGTIYALLLIYLGYAWRERAHDFSHMNYVRGSFSFANMLFTLGLLVIVWASYPPDNPFAAWGGAKVRPFLETLGMSAPTQVALLHSFWLYTTLLLMIYYWSSLRVTHQSRLAAAKWLAVFDRSRLLGAASSNNTSSNNR